MNPVALHLASGASAFSGAALLLLGVSVSPWSRGGWPKTLRTVAAWIGLALLLASATPWPLWLYSIFLGVFLSWFLAEEVPWVRQTTGSLSPQVALIATVALMVVLELPYTLLPKLPPMQVQHVYVIGDSISSGIGSGYPAWPDVFAARHTLSMTNLSAPGATVADAMSRTAQVKVRNAIVLVEIGGNDLLSGLPAQDFERQLESLLASLRQPGRTIVMLELPLFPFSGGYGRAQRALAHTFDVYLVPKRYFTGVLGSPGATEDGLHLSESGARMMADTVWLILGPALGRPETSGFRRDEANTVLATPDRVVGELGDVRLVGRTESEVGLRLCAPETPGNAIGKM
jgi:lysophospholipase L1-like esterase